MRWPCKKIAPIRQKEILSLASSSNTLCTFEGAEEKKMFAHIEQQLADRDPCIVRRSPGSGSPNNDIVENEENATGGDACFREKGECFLLLP